MITESQPNQSVEATGGSRCAQSEFVSQRRLPPVAYAWRYPRGTAYETSSQIPDCFHRNNSSWGSYRNRDC